MTAMPLEDHSLYEREQLARINATPAAPESFDPVAALRRVVEIADELASGIAGSPGPGVVAQRLRAALGGDSR